MKEIVNTDTAPLAIGPYSQAIKVNGFLFISGQLGLSPISGEFAGETVEAQAEQALKNIGAILENIDLSYSNIIKTTIFLVDIADFPKVNEIYKNYFNDNFPARSTIQVSKLPKGGLVEIEAIATSL